jgi:hypothetical protein
LEMGQALGVNDADAVVALSRHDELAAKVDLTRISVFSVN